MTQNNNSFNNFVVLSAELSAVAVKDAANGKKYKTANATLLGITYKGEDGLAYHPTVTCWRSMVPKSTASPAA